jgi:hypothetical protein
MRRLHTGCWTVLAALHVTFVACASHAAWPDIRAPLADVAAKIAALQQRAQLISKHACPAVRKTPSQALPS